MVKDLVGGGCNNDLSGEISTGDDDGPNLETDEAKDGTKWLFVTWQSVWHLASWDRFADFMVSKFGALGAAWGSEENISSPRKFWKI